MIVAQLNSQNAQYQVAMFLYAIGPAALKVYNGFQYSPDEDKNDLSISFKQSLMTISLAKSARHMKDTFSIAEIRNLTKLLIIM